ncbi:MAG: SPW repeat protein [Cyclobacteriaceae bacterium]
MRFIPTKTHGILDYLMGVLLIASPWIFGFANNEAAQWVPIVIGILVIGQSLFTNYEVSLIQIIPMPFHLGMDVATGLFLAASPWIFGFADFVYWPHLIFGILEVGAALTTHKVPDYVRHKEFA